MHKARAAALVVVSVLFFLHIGWTQNFLNDAQIGNPLAVRPVDRIAQRVDENQRVVLTGSRHPLAIARNFAGFVPRGQRLERMILVLKPDDAQEKALAELLRAQQDPESPYFHQWLTPQAFGKRFGVSTNDLAKVVSWLQGHGLEIDEIPASHRGIVFSGSSGQVESAFHTSMREYLAGGERHFANATDPEIPQALAGVVGGVVSLHDFRSAPQLVKSTPAYNNANGAHFLSPKDWVTVYDVGPLYTQGLDGTGQSNAVLGRVDVALQDVRAFRSMSGLPANDPQMIINGADPGFPDCNDEAESALDVEWAGAIARNATIKFVTSKSGASDGINLSAQYAVNNNVAPIVSLSYGLCEAAYSSAGNAFWNGLWSQAAAQGMSVFVSSGDSGAAGCDSPDLATATHGRGVNALCSSPYSTCVGGTQFNDVYNPEQYWSPTNGSGMSSALGYIPEVVWNESGWSGGLWSTSGGVSKVYSKPAWQVAAGVPADGMRDVPDVAMMGAIHDAYVIQIQGGIFYVSGTSAATPSLASVTALVLENAGARQGNIDPALYSLANLQFSANGAAVFHDITSGNNSVPGVTGYNAGVGYDLATGLGSVDANLLINHWSDRLGSNFTITPASSALQVAVGSSSTVSITEAGLGGFAAPVTLSASGAPTGVTVTLSPSTLSPGGSSTMTVKASSSASPGTYSVTITGSGGGLTRTAALAVTILSPPSFSLSSSASSLTISAGTSATATITTAALNGFSSSVALSVSGLPKGLTAKFTPASLAKPGSGSSTLTLTAASSAASGSFSLTITATGGGVTKAVGLGVTVIVPTFTLTADATSANVTASSGASIKLTTAVVNGFKSALTLSLTGLPKGITAKFSPGSIATPASGDSTLTLTEASGAVSGTHSVTISASGGGVTKTQAITLTVVAPGFTLTLSGASVSIRQGGSLSITATITPVNAFNSAVALSVSGLPRGVTSSLSPSSLAAPGSGSTTLSLNVASGNGSNAGKYTLTVTGTGGGLTQSQKLTLTITR